MTETLYSPKIKPEHLARKAIVYLRQSSEKQVRQNKESQRLQYDVAERMRALGWKQVEIVDGDLGSSAAMASARREGFERVLSSVALGEVGIVGSREVSRLSRTDKDWCRLLEVCQIFGTLIADEQQVYDLNYLDYQVVLGIKGTLSVVELKVLRQRLQAGQESKARRGELFKRLPVGYVRDTMGKVRASFFIATKRLKRPRRRNANRAGCSRRLSSPRCAPLFIASAAIEWASVANSARA